jgi:hypothetical protein
MRYAQAASLTGPIGPASLHAAHPGSSVAVFICSSDGRKDVLDRVLPSVLKFWPDCPYPIYVGLNSRDWPLPVGTPVLAPASEWHRECTLQLAQLVEDYLIVILDDFLIGAPVNQARLANLVEDAVTLDLEYLRLVPLGRSLLARLAGWRPPELKPGIERVGAGRPFYSALQIAIWRKGHLQSMLQRPLSIWEFEHECIPGSMHWAVKDRRPIVYRHVVERGCWLPDARSLLQRAGLSAELGDRPVWPKSRYARVFLDQVRWVVLGYAAS